MLIQLNDLFPNRDAAAEFVDYLEEWDAEPGEYVYQHGQPADAIDLIEVGEVTVYLGGQQEQTHRIQALGAGNVGRSRGFLPSEAMLVAYGIRHPESGVAKQNLVSFSPMVEASSPRRRSQ